MGCDISVIVELRGEDKKWKAIKPPKPDGAEDLKWYEPERWTWEVGRDYNSFAVMADVRNGDGFAGIERGDPFIPISPPRGIPQDAAPVPPGRHGPFEYGEHSTSWLLLSEVLGYDWDSIRREWGFVDLAGYREWKEKGTPSRYSAMVFGQEVQVITHQEMEQFLRHPAGKNGFFTKVEWHVSNKEACGALWNLVKRIERTFPRVEPDRIRLIFGFWG